MSKIRRGGPARAGGERGFTIIETSIALCVMLIAGVGVISVFLYAANYGSAASDRARALALAQERMEQVRSMDYDDLAFLFDDVDFNGKVTLGSTAKGQADARTFTVATTVENDPVTGATARQKRITVTVTPDTPQAWAGAVRLRLSRSENEMGAN
jgi:Tfp pilus assembly protein PilV